MNDPYANSERCIERLLREYREHKRLIVALDFDDTVYDYHGVGSHHIGVLQAVRECQKLGFHIVLFTGSDKSEWDAQCLYLKEHGITVDCVNVNPIPLPFGKHGKIYFNILLDDRAGLGQALNILECVLRKIKIDEGGIDEALSGHSA